VRAPGARRAAPRPPRGHGSISAIGVGGDPRAVEVRWDSRVFVVSLAVTPPAAGTPTEAAYDPSQPDHAIVPGAAVLADADRAFSGLVFAGLVAFLVLATGSWRLVTRTRLLRRPSVRRPVRRVRIQRGLITRSWLEIEPDTWVPVYFDPVLVTMPSPVTATLYGSRLTAASVNGVVLYPSGRAVSTEPRGRRIDNPSSPDSAAADRAAASNSLLRQFRVDAAALLPAPVVGLFWSYVDSSGFAGFVGATAVCATVALWLWSIRGSDPS
jgi:hypothetical protein